MPRGLGDESRLCHLTVPLLGYLHGRRVDDAHAVQACDLIEGLDPLQSNPLSRESVRD